MTVDEHPEILAWIDRLAKVGRRASAAAKDLQKVALDPFAASAKIESVNKAMQKLEVPTLAAPNAVISAMADECVRRTAEFWGRFEEASKSEGWELHGRTNRRLVARGLFVELKGDSVLVEGAPGRQSPYVPALIPAIRKLVSELIPGDDSVREFLELVARAYDDVSGSDERSIERVFRHAMMLSQPQSFWSDPTPAKFRPITRPIFRARLSAIMQERLETRDGRCLRLGTTLETKERWEIYSPGEGHVVQVGRMVMTKERA